MSQQPDAGIASRTDRDEMIASAMPLARDLAKRCRGQGVDDDELESGAMLALVEAAGRYRPGAFDRRTFGRWAELWVIRALRRLVADAPHCRVAEVPRQLRRQAARVRLAAARLAARGLLRPTDAEVAFEAMVPIGDVELVRTIPGVVTSQGIAEYADARPGRPAREPELTPAFGPQPGWSPLTTCAVVHTDERPIPAGSSTCCMVCHASGKDGHPALRRSKATDPEPEPRRKAGPAAAKKAPDPASRRERRKRLFGPAAAVA